MTMKADELAQQLRIWSLPDQPATTDLVEQAARRRGTAAGPADAWIAEDDAFDPDPEPTDVIDLEVARPVIDGHAPSRAGLVAVAVAVLVPVLIVAGLVVVAARRAGDPRGPASAPGSVPPSVVGTAPSSRADERLVPVFIVREQVPRGMAGQDAVAGGFIGPTEVPGRFAPAGAISSTAAIDEKVALFAIPPGALVVDGLFVDAGGPLTSASMPDQPVPSAPAGPPPTNADGLAVVYVAASTVPRGTSVAAAMADGSITASAIDPRYRPPTAITSLDQIAATVALYDLAPGTMIVDGMFIPP